MKPAADNDRIVTTIDIAASPERVFAALTDPQELAAWWGSETGYRTCDWRVDARTEGEWSARTIDPSGNEGSIRGAYTVVDPPNALESTWHASWDDDVVTTVRYDLSPTIIDDAPGTRLTVTHAGFNGFVACACAGATQGTALRELLAIGTRCMITRRPRTCVA
jgi:uncharacterized protein YndB with AHSA1/START domain